MPTLETTAAIVLLLLPPPPFPVNATSIYAAYAPTLTAILDSLSTLIEEHAGGVILDIAVDCPSLNNVNDAPRNLVCPKLQHLFACLYRLFCMICARKSIDIVSSAGIDARIVLLQPSSSLDNVDAQEVPSTSWQFGPIIDLSILVLSDRPWQRVYGVETEGGEALLQSFLRARHAILRRNTSFRRLPGGINMIARSDDDLALSITPGTGGHCKVAVGGTFDHLHVGHKLLLTCTALLLQPKINEEDDAQRVLTVGITGDALLKNKKYADVMESWSARRLGLIRFLEAIMNFKPSKSNSTNEHEASRLGFGGTRVVTEFDPILKVDCVEISDPFGPTITDEYISGLVVSAETRAGGKAVNDKRAEKGWPALDILEVEVLDAEIHDDSEAEYADNGFQTKISSTEIRRQLEEEKNAHAKKAE